MNKPILLIDANYLSHRAFHAMGDLSHNEIATGAIFGVLKDIVSLQDKFMTGRCAFAFDIGRGHRHDLLSTYKSSRKKRHEEATDEEKQARQDFNEQLRLLRADYLPSAGFKNVFSAEGYEADDIIAQLAKELPKSDEGIIVSADKDLYQCLRPNVWMWNPHKAKSYNINSFRDEWNLEPSQWPLAKALAGDDGDDVPGLPGIGLKTAAKHIRGELKKTTKAHATIKSNSDANLDRNLKLVTLPYPGTPIFGIEEDEVTEEKWQALADRLGMQSIRNDVPRAAGRRNRGRKREGGFGFE